MSTLSNRMIDIARSMKKHSSIVLWTSVLSAAKAGDGLSAAEREEAQSVGEEKIAKQATKIAVPDNSLFDWASGSLVTPGGARIPRVSADREIYNWRIAEVNRTIARFVRYRDALVAERDALPAKI